MPAYFLCPMLESMAGHDPQSHYARGSIMLESRTGGRLIVEALHAHGVDRVFCVPGESFLEVLDALHDQKEIDLVVAKHEGAAANMAEADGKLTGRPGICMVTRGPGATHASIGVHIAQQDSTPMILLIGQVAQSHRGREAFQEVDYEQMFGGMAKWVVELDDVSRIPELMARAFQVAMSGRPGPVVISLPEDVLAQQAAVPQCQATPLLAAGMPKQGLNRIDELLRQAQRPLLMIGGSHWTEQGIADLRRFVNDWNLPVAASFRRQDVFDNRDPHYVGHLSLGINPALAKRIEQADLILALGTRLGDVPTDAYTLLEVPRPAQTLVHLYPEPSELGRVYQADLALAVTASEAVSALAGLQSPVQVAWDQWTQGARRDLETFRDYERQDQTPLNGVDMSSVVRHLNASLPDDAFVTNGAGNYSVWVHRFYEYKQYRTELAPICGAMGYGLPAAVAAALRHPERDVICFAGDGCFLMYPQEMVTAMEQGLKLTILVVNNGMYGTIRMHQERAHPGRVSGTNLQGPDFVAMAKACGAYAEKVLATEDFAGAFERAQQSGGLALLELMVDPQQITPQMRLS